MGSESSDNNDDMGFHSRSDQGIMNCPSSTMSTNPFIASAWGPVVSLNQHETFGGSSVISQPEFTSSPYTVLKENQVISGISQLVHNPSDSSFVELLPEFPCFGSRNFSDVAGSYGLSECAQIGNNSCLRNYVSSSKKEAVENGGQSQEDQQLLEKAALGSSRNGKRKRVVEPNSIYHPVKNGEGDQQKDPSGESSDVPKEQDEKKSKTEQNNGTNLRGKHPAKQRKDSSQSGEAPKENYIHVRARRGQATNSHSLAERVRREKISERMRVLQELVPGCNKITGKAVMLDEIINYVQSLQQQVEFLSMKLAAVNPELNIDIDRILSKDILYSGTGNAAILGFNPRMSTDPHLHGMFQTSMPIMANTNPQFPTLPQNVLDNDLQSLLQMGFDSCLADGFGPNGQLKTEL